jgi:hypothetical protein
MLHEQKGGVVGPLQVVEDEECRTIHGQAGQDVGQAPEEVQPLLFRRQLQGRGEVGEPAPQLGQEPGDLGRGVA